MGLGRRQLFIYWRVAAADLPAALQALRDCQRVWMAQQPALQCRLCQRGDGAAAEATVMESYVPALLAEGGIGVALQRQIEQDDV